MKIYSEEQVKDMLNKVMMLEHHIVEFLNNYTPIELPTDEEIENYYGKVYDFGDWEGFKRGTKWMRDKIQGGNQ